MKCASMLLLSLALIKALGQDVPGLPAEFGTTASRDVLKLDPGHYKREIDNERVRVLRSRLGPEERVPMHDDRSAIVIAITDVHIRLVRPDRRTFDVHMAAGETRWGFGDTHAIENLIDRPCEFIAVELKR